MPRTLPNGESISEEWFDRGAGPAAKTLRNLAKKHLGDEWRVSELAERVIVVLAGRHGGDPKRRVIVRAVWETKNLAAGGRKERWHRQQTKRVTSLSAAHSLNASDWLVGESFAKQCYSQILLETIRDRLGTDAQMQRAYQLLRAGYSWSEVSQEMGGIEITEVWRKRFWRVVRNLC